MSNLKDTLYADKKNVIEGFVFSEEVADVFDDMVSRSIPGYKAIVNMIGVLASNYAKENSYCYDLGCSLGAVTLSMGRGLKTTNTKVIAIDNSQAMVKRCRENVKKAAFDVDVICGDIRNAGITRASVVVLNFTLQFFEPSQRLDLIRRIYEGLLPGGILIISDKIAFSDQNEQILQEHLHREFKRLNGYSGLEIAQKRAALDKVLVPDTLKGHKERLVRAGFKNTHVWFQCFNFMSLAAFK